MSNNYPQKLYRMYVMYSFCGTSWTHRDALEMLRIDTIWQMPHQVGNAGHAK